MAGPVNNVTIALETPKEFAQLYYKQMDTCRHLSPKMYHETGLLVWNGNAVTGLNNIQKFLFDLPMTTHVLKTLTAQRVEREHVGQRVTYVIEASGKVTYHSEKIRKPFQQTFLVVLVDEAWKIASDCFRLKD